MLIRKNQMDQMSADMMKSFEDRVYVHLEKFFPGKIEKLGEKEARAQIQAGIKRADEYDVVRERDVAKFIDLKFSIHQEFDKHPEMPWAAEILNDKSLDGEQKMIKIYDQLPKRLAELARRSKG